VVASASGENMKTAAQNAAVQALEILKHERDS
jgi:dsRNA-specific ribonuclease